MTTNNAALALFDQDEGTCITRISARLDVSSNCRVAPTVLSRQLAALRETASRSQPRDCGCRLDRRCRCTDRALSNHDIDGGRDAALHILATGYTPVIDPEVMRALWSRGGPDRDLVQRLANLNAGLAA